MAATEGRLPENMATTDVQYNCGARNFTEWAHLDTATGARMPTSARTAHLLSQRADVGIRAPNASTMLVAVSRCALTESRAESALVTWPSVAYPSHKSLFAWLRPKTLTANWRRPSSRFPVGRACGASGFSVRSPK